MSFGYSVTDLMKGASLSYHLIKALTEIGGPSTEYQEAINELAFFQHAFMEVTQMQSSLILDQATKNGASQIVLSSVGLIEDFLQRTKKYRDTFRSDARGSAVAAGWQKMRWVLFTADELKTLKDSLHVKLAHLHLLLSISNARLATNGIENPSSDIKVQVIDSAPTKTKESPKYTAMTTFLADTSPPEMVNTVFASAEGFSSTPVATPDIDLEDSVRPLRGGISLPVLPTDPSSWKPKSVGLVTNDITSTESRETPASVTSRKSSISSDSISDRSLNGTAKPDPGDLPLGRSKSPIDRIPTPPATISSISSNGILNHTSERDDRATPMIKRQQQQQQQQFRPHVAGLMISDITPVQQMTEEYARRKLTFYEVYNLRKADPLPHHVEYEEDRHDSKYSNESKTLQSTWQRAIITRDAFDQVDIMAKISSLNRHGRSVTTKKKVLSAHQQLQVTKLLDEKNANEFDPSFGWTLAQIEITTGPNKVTGLTETDSIILYLKRAPHQAIDALGLHKAIEMARARANSSQQNPSVRAGGQIGGGMIRSGNGNAGMLRGGFGMGGNVTHTIPKGTNWKSGPKFNEDSIVEIISSPKRRDKSPARKPYRVGGKKYYSRDSNSSDSDASFSTSSDDERRDSKISKGRTLAGVKLEVRKGSKGGNADNPKDKDSSYEVVDNRRRDKPSRSSREPTRSGRIRISKKVNYNSDTDRMYSTMTSSSDDLQDEIKKREATRGRGVSSKSNKGYRIEGSDENKKKSWNALPQRGPRGPPPPPPFVQDIRGSRQNNAEIIPIDGPLMDQAL